MGLRGMKVCRNIQALGGFWALRKKARSGAARGASFVLSFSSHVDRLLGQGGGRRPSARWDPVYTFI